MAWVESISASFRARHDQALSEEADQLLDELERTRERLDEIFARTVGELTVVLHSSPSSLAMSNPLVPATWMVTAPAARRYIAGWVGAHELHVLAASVLDERASGVPGSREMLQLTGPALYTRRVVVENNQDLAAARAPRRMVAELKWAWLLEGAARWLAGQTDQARAAINRRLREGQRPSFPPGLRDATLLGGTVFDLLAREEGLRAVAQLATRLHPEGGKAALAEAFTGRSLSLSESAWLSHLRRLAGG